ncbi:MAG: DUF3857 domain-containing protein [Planctomycetota bacterium]
MKQFISRLKADTSSSALPDRSELERWGEVTLLEDVILVMHDDGSTSTRTRRVVMPFQEDALKEWDEVAIPFDPATSRAVVKTARVITPEGKKKSARPELMGYDLRDGDRVLPWQVVVTRFSPLPPGVIVEMEDELDSHAVNDLGPHIWTQFFLKTATPCRRRRLTFGLSTRFKAGIKLHNDAVPAEETERNGYRLWTWDLTDVPGVSLDGNEPHFRDFMPWVEISTLDSWQPMAEQYRHELFPPRTDRVKARESREIAGLAEKIFGGIDDQTQRVLAAYRYASKDLRYGRPLNEVRAPQPRGANTLREDLRGDCKDKSLLLKRLLNHAEVPSTLVLVSTREEGLAPPLPPGRFNHAILCCKPGDRQIWMDPAAGWYTFGEMPSNAQGVIAMPLKPTGEVKVGRVPKARPEQHGAVVTQQQRFEDDGGLSLAATVELRGDESAMARAAMRRADNDDREAYFRSRIIAGRTGMSVTKMEFEPHEDLTDSFRYRYEARWSYAGSRVGDLWQFPLILRHPFLSDQLALRDQRKTPVGSFAPARYQANARIELPAGFRLAECPESIDDQTPWCGFRLTFSHDDEGWVSYAWEAEAREGVIKPGEPYVEFCRHYRVCLEAAHRKLVLQPLG